MAQVLPFLSSAELEKLERIFKMGGSVEKQTQKALGFLPPCGNRCRFTESAICSSWVHPPLKIELNLKFKTLRWRLLRWRLTLSDRMLENVRLWSFFQETILVDWNLGGVQSGCPHITRPSVWCKSISVESTWPQTEMRRTNPQEALWGFEMPLTPTSLQYKRSFGWNSFRKNCISYASVSLKILDTLSFLLIRKYHNNVWHTKHCIRTTKEVTK